MFHNNDRFGGGCEGTRVPIRFAGARRGTDNRPTVRPEIPGIILEMHLTNTPWGYIVRIPLGGILNGGVTMEQEKRCCCHKTTQRSQEETRKLVNRLNRIEGQIRGIRAMVESEAYCNDILTQSAAVSAAMNAFNRELLAAHIRSCVVRDIRAGDDAVVDELVSTLQKLMK